MGKAGEGERERERREGERREKGENESIFAGMRMLVDTIVCQLTFLQKSCVTSSHYA